MANAGFWVGYGIAKRLCDWIHNDVLGTGAGPEVPANTELTSVVDVLLQCGGPMARALEERITARRAAAN